jgi:hypothetical protein
LRIGKKEGMGGLAEIVALASAALSATVVRPDRALLLGDP